MTFRAVDVREAGALTGAFTTMVKDRTEAIIVGDGPFLWTQRRRIAELAARYRLPTAYTYREGPEAGGLLSYGTSIPRPGIVLPSISTRSSGVPSLPICRSSNRRRSSWLSTRRRRRRSV
jgi:hypothetical protein